MSFELCPLMILLYIFCILSKRKSTDCFTSGLLLPRPKFFTFELFWYRLCEVPEADS